jgi:hypothetical protein
MHDLLDQPNIFKGPVRGKKVALLLIFGKFMKNGAFLFYSNLWHPSKNLWHPSEYPQKGQLFFRSDWPFNANCYLFLLF